VGRLCGVRAGNVVGAGGASVGDSVCDRQEGMLASRGALQRRHDAGVVCGDQV
jgi:hypothetical protein